MIGKPISREKLMVFFRSVKQSTEGADNNYRLLYIMGRNTLADIGMTSLILGDFDEDGE
jgi:hypothetical protein